MKAAIVFNANAGTLDREKCQQRATEILATCAQRGIVASAHLCDGAQLTATARALALRGDLDAVIAAGGDGTVSAVAAGVVGTAAANPRGRARRRGRPHALAADVPDAAGSSARVATGSATGRTTRMRPA